MNKLFSIFAILLINSVIADEFSNYCIGNMRLALKKSEMRVKCNKRAKEMSGGYCIYTVDSKCFIFESWDGHGSKFCPNFNGGLTETDLKNN